MSRIITDMLDLTTKRFHDKVAFADENKSMSFAEVRDNARKIATVLARRGVFHKPVAVFLDKSVDEIVSFMGVLYSGNFFSPIDVEMPLNRTNNIMASLSPECIITNKDHVDRVKELPGSKMVIVVEEAYNGTIDERTLERCGRKTLSSDPAYVLFTSGSTGLPKGVIVSHKSVISYAEWVTDTFSINEDVVLGNQTPFYFSMSVLDIYTTINTGCTMEIIPKNLFSKPEKLMDYVLSRKVNTIYWVPSALNLVANSGVLDTTDMSTIKKILFAGEVMPNKQLNILRRHLPNTLFANLFGPTEVTDICTYYVVDRDFKDDEPLPIGYPCINTDVIILDNDDREILPEDTESIGELCVRGIQLAYGYYNNKKKTDEVFVQNPLNHFYPEKIYRTGDLVKYNSYGEIMYIGRKDFQIKVSGYRVELGEIETAISSVNGVQSTCCLFDDERKLIVCVYTGEVDKRTIRSQIKTMIPRYMLPHKYVKLDNMPLNTNGKIDRIRLKIELISESE